MRLRPTRVVALVAALTVWSSPAAPAGAQQPPGAPSVPIAPSPAGAPPSPGTPPRAALPVDVTGAERISYDGETQQYIFLGPHVVVTRGDRRLEGPEIHYDATRRVAVLPRRGRLVAPTLELEADALTADLSGRHVHAEGDVRARFLDEGVWGRLTARAVDADDRPDLRLIDARGDVVSVRGDEELRGDHVRYDRRTQRGVAEGHAQAFRGGDRIQASRIDADLAAETGEADGAVVLERASEHVRGTADHATYSRRTDTAVLTGHAVLTRERDVVTADRITVLLKQHRAIADGRPQITAYPRESTP